VVEGKSDREAALDAGYAASTADNTKFKLWSRPQVHDYYRDIMRRAKTPEALVRRAAQLVDGKFVRTRQRRTLDAAGNVIESVIERTEVEDPATSLRAIELIQEAADYVPPRRPDILVNASLTQLQLISTSDLEAALVEIRKKRKELENGTGTGEPGAAVDAGRGPGARGKSD
jgi:phage terminase small subunit